MKWKSGQLKVMVQLLFYPPAPRDEAAKAPSSSRAEWASSRRAARSPTWRNCAACRALKGVRYGKGQLPSRSTLPHPHTGQGQASIHRVYGMALPHEARQTKVHQPRSAKAVCAEAQAPINHYIDNIRYGSGIAVPKSLCMGGCMRALVGAFYVCDVMSSRGSMRLCCSPAPWIPPLNGRYAMRLAPAGLP